MVMEVSNDEEPYAEKPHVRFCEGRKTSHRFVKFIKWEEFICLLDKK